MSYSEIFKKCIDNLFNFLILSNPMPLPWSGCNCKQPNFVPGQMLNGKMLQRKMLHGQMLHGQMLHGQMLHGQMVLGHLSTVKDAVSAVFAEFKLLSRWGGWVGGWIKWE